MLDLCEVPFLNSSASLGLEDAPIPPPQQANRLDLHKFSPYAADPSAYGIREVKPFAIQRLIYGATDELQKSSATS